MRLLLVALAPLFLGSPVVGLEFHLRLNPDTHLPEKCRLFDTRAMGTGARLEAGNDYDFNARGNPGPSYGGDPDCGVPVEAVAIEVNLVAANPTALGWMSCIAWEMEHAPEPTTSDINFGPNSQQPIANRVLIPLSPVGSGGYDFKIRPGRPAGWLEPEAGPLVHAIGDLIGWYTEE